MNTGEVIALIKAFGGSGGGSSGGGVLVVHDVDGTLDKTWQEIHDALLTGGAIVLRADGQDAYCDIIFKAVKSSDESSFNVACGSIEPPGNAGAWLYSASSASGYPSYTE